MGFPARSGDSHPGRMGSSTGARARRSRPWWAVGRALTAATAGQQDRLDLGSRLDLPSRNRATCTSPLAAKYAECHRVLLAGLRVAVLAATAATAAPLC